MKAAQFDYARPDELVDAAALLRQSAGMGKVLGGGQSFGPMLNLRLVQPELLVDLAAIGSLRACLDAPGAVTLGAAITHAQIEDCAVPDPSGGMMPFVAANIAYRAIRNRGTFGGSLAHADPAADWINLMALLDACYLLEGPDGRREVAQVDWMDGAFTTALREDEVLTAVRIPRLSASAHWSYIKINRKAGEFAEAIAAFVDDTNRGVRRAVIGATDGTPHLIADASPLLDGWDGSFADAQLQAAGLIPDTYEYQLHAVALERAAAEMSRKKGIST